MVILRRLQPRDEQVASALEPYLGKKESHQELLRLSGHCRHRAWHSVGAQMNSASGLWMVCLYPFPIPAPAFLRICAARARHLQSLCWPRAEGEPWGSNILIRMKTWTWTLTEGDSLRPLHSAAGWLRPQ